MKNKNLLFLFFLSFNLFSEIHEKNSIKALHEHVYVDNKENNKTLVVLDLDNTTYRTKKSLNNKDEVGDAWFSASIEHLQKNHGMDFMAALDIVLPEYINLQKDAEVEPVEKDIVEIIAQFQKDKIPVIAVTARSLPLEETTIKQLKSINIDLSINCLAGNKDIVFHNLDHPCKYTNGVLFVSNNDKGKALLKYLDHVKHEPKKVVFADDKLKYAQHIDIVCKSRNIESVCIRYGFMDEEVKNYKLPEETKVKLSSKVKGKEDKIKSEVK